MLTPTKAACRFTGKRVVQAADMILSTRNLKWQQTGSTLLLLAAGVLQLRCPEDQLAGWCSVHNLYVSQQTAEQGSDSCRLIYVNVNGWNPTRTGSLWAFIGLAGIASETVGTVACEWLCESQLVVTPLCNTRSCRVEPKPSESRMTNHSFIHFSEAGHRVHTAEKKVLHSLIHG